MNFPRIQQDITTSLSHRFTSEDTDLSLSLIMEVQNDEPSMYILVSYPVACSLMPEDLPDEGFTYLEDSEVGIDAGYYVNILAFKNPILSQNENQRVFTDMLSFTINEITRLSQLIQLRKKSQQ